MSDVINVSPAIALAVEQAKEHQQLADEAVLDAEKRAHRSTMRALDKAAMEMARGNAPVHVGNGVWMVNSRTQAGVVYRVDTFTQQCSCANAHACWHLAAANVCEELRTRAEHTTHINAILAEHSSHYSDDDLTDAKTDDDSDPSPRYDPIETESLWEMGQRYQ